MSDVILGLHIAAGALGLLAGATAALARKAPGVHTAAGWTYQSSVLLLTGTTVVLVARDPGLWPFLLIAVLTQAAAAAAVVVRRRRRSGWVPLHVQLVLSSYVSFITAFTVTTVGGLASWLVPTTVGSVVVAFATTRAKRASGPSDRPPRTDHAAARVPQL